MHVCDSYVNYTFRSPNATYNAALPAQWNQRIVLVNQDYRKQPSSARLTQRIAATANRLPPTTPQRPSDQHTAAEAEELRERNQRFSDTEEESELIATRHRAVNKDRRAMIDWPEFVLSLRASVTVPEKFPEYLHSSRPAALRLLFLMAARVRHSKMGYQYFDYVNTCMHWLTLQDQVMQLPPGHYRLPNGTASGNLAPPPSTVPKKHLVEDGLFEWVGKSNNVLPQSALRIRSNGALIQTFKQLREQYERNGLLDTPEDVGPLRLHVGTR